MTSKRFTILTQQGGRNVAQTTRLTPASVKKPTFTSASVADPQVTVRMLNEFVDHVRNQTDIAANAPFNGGVIIQNIALSAGVTTTIAHTLNRPYQGWWCVRAQSAAFSAFEVALAAGLKASAYLAIKSNNTGIYDIFVF